MNQKQLFDSLVVTPLWIARAATLMTSAAPFPMMTHPGPFCTAFHDQFHGRADSSATVRSSEVTSRTVSDFASNSNPASFASVSIHPTAAAGGSVSR